MHEGLQTSSGSPINRSSRTSLAGTRLTAASFLSGAERRALEDAALPARSVHAGNDLVREGEATDRLYLITEGWACRYKTTRDGNRQIVALLMPGDTANLDSLMFEHSDCGVRTLTAITVVAVPRDRALALSAQHAGIARAFTLLAMIEYAIFSQWALCMGRMSAHQRLAHLFCELSARSDRESGNESSFEMPLTQEQLADALGLTSVHVNRTVQRLRREGMIGTESRIVTIPDVTRLRDAGEFDPAYLHVLAVEAAASDRLDRRGLSHPSTLL